MKNIVSFRKIILLSICILSIEVSFSQSQYTPNDTIWKRTVFRLLDLNRPTNRNMLYIDSTYNHGGLIGIIMEGFKNKQLTGYQNVYGSQFSGTQLLDDIKIRLGGGADTIRNRMDVNGNPINDTVIARELEYKKVTLYEIIEEYYFEKRNSKFGKKIVGICPIKVYKKEADGLSENEDEYLYKKIAWLRFPEVKTLLENVKIEDASNQNAYYHFFETDNSYDSYIISINNNFDKGISDYAGINNTDVFHPSLEAMLESRRIEYELHNFEMNLWEF